jgi:hypothetical protein
MALLSGVLLSMACNGTPDLKVPLGRVGNTYENYQLVELDEEDERLPGPETGFPEGYIKYFIVAQVTNVGDVGYCTFTGIVEGDVRGDKSIAQNVFLENGEEKEIGFWWFVKGEITSIKVIAVNLTNLP